MKVKSAVISFSEKEINKILSSLDLPITNIDVSCTEGKMVVKIKKGITIKINIIFTADGRHLSATIEMGAVGNPLISRILKLAMENASEWGVTLIDRTLVFDPQVAMRNSDIAGDIRIEKIAVGTKELVLALEADIPVGQFLKAPENSGK